MAYEAYNATVAHIAQETYKVWGTGGDHSATLEKLCKDANVEAHHVRFKLNQMIHDAHLNSKLVRIDD